MAAHVNYPTHDFSEPNDDSDIRDILHGFVLKRASTDTTIGEDRSSILASFVEDQEPESESRSQVCTEVGQILVGISDQIDAAHGNIIQELIVKVGNPNLAFRTFQSVARTLFSWDSTGAVKVTWYRIAALLGFCYNLCKQFLLSVDNRRALKAFFSAVVGYLTRFLFEGRLLNWVRSQGGWRSALSALSQQPIASIGWPVWAGIGVVAAGASLLWMYNHITTS